MAARRVRRTAPRTAAESSSQQTVVKPVAHLSIKQWSDNSDLQRRLRNLLNDPVFHLAHNTLLHATAPGGEPASKADPGVSAEATNNALALRYAHRSGMGHTFRLLKYLATETGTSIPQTPYGGLLEEDE